MWGVEQLVSATVVLVVILWLLIVIARNPSAMHRVPRRAADGQPEEARTPTPPKRPLGVRAWEVISTLFVLSLVLVAVVGVIWAAFAFHPGLGLAAVAIALLLMMAWG